MAKSVKKDLNRALSSHTLAINEILKILDEPAFSLQRVKWEEVIKLGDQISKQATVAGMLWSGEEPKVGELLDNMRLYCDMLQGFLLLCHGSMVGAGPTLCACIRTSAKQVADSSLSLLRQAVSCYTSQNEDLKTLMPKLTGVVWEACAALKRTPTNNTTAVGRGITRVAASIKDVLREMGELKPAAGCSLDGSHEKGEGEDHNGDSCAQDGSPNDGNSGVSGAHLDIEDSSVIGDDLGDDLSNEEMMVAKLVTVVLSDTLLVFKELLRFISGLSRQSCNGCEGQVDHLERILEICQGVGVQVDELGASVYPPQEASSSMAASIKIVGGMAGIEAELQRLGGAHEGLHVACEKLKISLRKLESELGPLTMDLSNGF
ncbi:uncharacterized protein LOC18433824 isoform X2 [Amborella trichopoda]|uniref:Uncharacterized protein n=1 Tax=Amborella trichopoda TaxID=13333 RepID=W1PD72_AMBTC|nr:uncharacterized protein LOC18433824 isoform X2 [Amborella trichopoda]ERN05644.1 hypothetical protein AMTR_s00006p00113000 [Amborella trichopoda]|eukprot:XP_006843969.1 uncharacterized protein LOC18433824 isoform X2 [Amborella trichopoda]